MLEFFKPKNCMVIRKREYGGITFEHVDTPIGLKRRLWNNKSMYVAIQRDGSGKLEPYEPPEEFGALLPGDLYDAQEWGFLGIVFRPSESLLEKINPWLSIAALGMGIFTLFILLGGRGPQ